jgi:hypothetical protein
VTNRAGSLSQFLKFTLAAARLASRFSDCPETGRPGGWSKPSTGPFGLRDSRRQCPKEYSGFPDIRLSGLHIRLSAATPPDATASTHKLVRQNDRLHAVGIGIWSVRTWDPPIFCADQQLSYPPARALNDSADA